MHHNDATYDAYFGEVEMGVISLRNLPREIARIVRERARREGISLNKAVIRLLEETQGKGAPSGNQYDDLDWFAGSWSREEAEEFRKVLEAQRQIDPEHWE